MSVYHHVGNVSRKNNKIYSILSHLIDNYFLHYSIKKKKIICVLERQTNKQKNLTF